MRKIGTRDPVIAEDVFATGAALLVPKVSMSDALLTIVHPFDESQITGQPEVAILP
jgi:hypothetical protein